MTEPTASRPWSQAVASALDRWRQGHVLDSVPLVAVGVSHTDDALWAAGLPTSLAIAGAPIFAEDPQVLRRSMVLSQGCDLVKPKFPCVTIAPVYNASEVLSPGQQDSARAGMTWHLIHLTAEWASSGFWVADLRMETSVDKSVLAGAEPMEAFADEVGYARLAERLGATRQRPAVPEPTLDHVVKPLKKSLAERRQDGAAPLIGVREVRVQSDHPTTPATVTLFVVAEEPSSVDRGLWEAAFDEVCTYAATRGIVVMGPEITTLWEMSAGDYLTSQAVDDADAS